MEDRLVGSLVLLRRYHGVIEPNPRPRKEGRRLNDDVYGYIALYNGLSSVESRHG